ncbi:hypothetical protein [Dyella nitratireducens]|uniref:Uncharacterized protein n=1 Tax=Dyella nitratireducens TaxID=1849580 RepID=A0ABQ1G638_9GAMM|nr:hypothetical protein [Dyella nitratireducens]GGA37494.1 hypothetical protein GCM10010981_28300 [Dyella nitratireducens]GLQ41208.1 hypothetical protein GCM10007902_10580 [Dyella nitratireducens]
MKGTEQKKTDGSPVKRFVKRLLCSILVVLCMFSSSAYAQSIQKYYGYYYADANNPPAVALDEMKGHINLYAIMSWSGDTSDAGRASSLAYLMTELAKAKAAHVHAIIPGYPFLFNLAAGSTSCWQNYPAASQEWSSLVQTMVQTGYLIPGDPDRSTVTAVYLVDEPNLGSSCLSDVNGTANPALANAVNAIHSNANTSSLPVASILTTSFDQISSGMRLLDWVGFDSYGDSDSQWYAHLNELKSYAPSKKIIIVPGAQSGQGCVGINDTTPFFQTMQSDSQVVWLAPFVWFSTSTCLGIRDLSTLRTTYETEGAGIKAQGCTASNEAALFCGAALTSFVLSSGQQHWGFVGASGDVYNLYWSASAGYLVDDASAVTKAQKADSGALTSYTLSSGEQHWGFIGTDGNIYNLSWTAAAGYTVANASAAAGAPPAITGALTSFALSSGEQHWGYIGTNGHVYNLYWGAGAYHVDDASGSAGAPQAASGALTSFTLPSGQQHWAYIGTNGDVYDLYWSAGSYYVADVSAATGAPRAASGALTSFTLPSGQQHWAYIGTNGNVYDLYWSAGSYYIADVTAAAGAPLASSGSLTSFVLPSGEQHWGYIGANGHIYNLYWGADAYHVDDASGSAGAPQAASSALTSFILPSGEQHWAYIGANGDVYNLYWSSGTYYVQDASAATALH